MHKTKVRATTPYEIHVSLPFNYPTLDFLFYFDILHSVLQVTGAHCGETVQNLSLDQVISFLIQCCSFNILFCIGMYQGKKLISDNRLFYRCPM